MPAAPPRQRLQVLRTLLGTGMLAPARPDRVVRSLATLRTWGTTAAAGYRAGSIMHPDRCALCDERGTLTFLEVHLRTNALASEMRRGGVGQGDGVAIMARNHRGFIEATVACSKLGANALYLNTSFAGPQITDVLTREDPAVVIYDEEFADLVQEGAQDRTRLISWSAPGYAASDPLLEQLIDRGETAELEPPSEKGRVVILTSGTTGTPKGAARGQPETMEPLAALLSKIPLHARETTMIAAPMSTRGVSPTSASASRSPPRSCCGAASTRRTRSAPPRTTGPAPWSSCRSCCSGSSSSAPTCSATTTCGRSG